MKTSLLAMMIALSSNAMAGNVCHVNDGIVSVWKCQSMSQPVQILLTDAYGHTVDEQSIQWNEENRQDYGCEVVAKFETFSAAVNCFVK